MYDVIMTGPFFEPGADLVAQLYIKRAEERVAEAVETRVNMLEHVYFKRPTGYYERHTTTRAMADYHLVTDSGVIYGPWLEGTGSRNFPVTRFKGYAIFRTVAQSMDRRAVQVADPVIRDLCKVLD